MFIGQPPHPVITSDALAGAVALRRRADLALFDAWLALQVDMDPWEAREHALLVLRLSERDVWALEKVTDRAHLLPACTAAFRDGTIGWSNLVSIVHATARLSGAALVSIDRQVAAHARQLAADGAAPDVALANCDRLVAEARTLSAVERSEGTAEARSRVIVQPSLDGGGTIIADCDPVLFADLTTGLDAAAPAPSADRSRGQDRADALGALARGALTGGHRSRTSVNVLVDLTDAAAPHTLGQLLGRATRGRAPRLSALMVETLACDAPIIATIVDGARPLAELRLQDTIPADVRRAVLARDRGCRFPSCTRPATWSDVHHLVHREDGGDHDPDNLLVLCRRHHRRLHRPRWSASLDPHTGRLTVTDPRGRVTTSMPAGRRPEVAATS